MNCEIANYADDNHLYYAHHWDVALKNTLEVDTNSAIDWFVNSYMDANPHRFQSSVLAGNEIYRSQFPPRRTLFYLPIISGY